MPLSGAGWEPEGKPQLLHQIPPKLLLSPVHACVKCPARLMGWSCRINSVDSGLKTLKEFIPTDFRDLKIYSLSSLRFLRQLPNQTE